MSLTNVFKPSPKQEGFWQQIGIPSRGPKLYKVLHEGLPFSIYGKLAKISGLERTELACAAVIASATLQRRSKSGKFNTDESDRLYRFAKVFKAALDLFEGEQKTTTNWLKGRVHGLGNKAPIEMLSTAAETEAVLNLIGQLEHGVFA